MEISVDEKCAECLTIMIHKSIYKLNRLFQGIKVASAIFQQIMDTMLNDIDFAVAYIDDILTKSENKLHK